jgi:pyruvate decarboxylase
MEAEYNDIATWQYSKIPETLMPEGSSHKVKTWKIKSRPELESLLQDEHFAQGEWLQVS